MSISINQYRAMTQNAAHRKSRAFHELFLMQCKAHNLPIPNAEVRFCLSRKWRFDFCWVDESIALEIEGAIYSNGGHTRGSGHVRDIEKFNEAALLGYKVFRFTTQQVKNGEAVLFMKRVLIK